MLMLKKIFAGLIVYQSNLRCIHWNVVGSNFDTIHKITDEYIEQTASYIDDIGEILKSLNERPLCLGCALELVKEDDDEQYLVVDCDKDFNYLDSLKAIDQMFRHLISMYEKSITDDNLSGYVISKLEEHQYWLSKEAEFKGSSRMKNVDIEVDTD